MRTPELTRVAGADGVRLAVRAAGRRDAPALVLLHGWASSGAVWARQLTDPVLTDRFRVLAPDLRGHGESDGLPDGRADSAVWAADVAAVLAHAGGPAVVVGWSYGGLVVTDHLRHRGTAGVAGVGFAGAITELGRGRRGGRIGQVMRAALPAALAEDPAVAVPALLDFVTGMSPDALPGDVVQRMLSDALRVPPRVRAALFRRDVTSADVLAALDVPVLVLHGRADAVVDPAAAEFAAETVPDATLRWFDGAGHLPFVERPAEFTAALAAFADRCFGSRAAGSAPPAVPAAEPSEVAR